MKQKSKRGLSDVITTVLIILLVLAAVAIIAAFVFPALQNAGERITADCLQLNLEPVKCSKFSTTSGTTTLDYVNVTYKWAAGDVDLVGVKLIVIKTDGSSLVVDAAKPADVLTTNTKENIQVDNAAKLKLSGVLKTESNNNITCAESLVEVNCQ